MLANLLPYLAVSGTVIGTLLMTAEPAAALQHGRHAPRSHHNHLARQAAKRQSSIHPIANQIVRRADGTKCRVRGVYPSASASASSVAASSAIPSASAVAPSSAAAAAPAPAVESSAAAAPSINAGEAWTEPSAAAQAVAPAASSAAPAAPAAPVTAPSYSGGGAKYALAWPNGDWATSGQPDYVGNFVAKSSIYYTWSPHNVGSADSIGMAFAPMLWGPKQRDDFNALKGTWGSNVNHVLFYNEPNEHSQCNMGSDNWETISDWMNLLVPLRSKYQLGAAATTSAPSGLEWVLNFPKACVAAGNSAADCEADFVPLHYYDIRTDHFKDYVTNFHTQTGKKIWVTEYADHSFNGEAQPDEGATWAFHQEMASWFDAQDFVEFYMPFGVMRQMQGVTETNRLMDDNGAITPLGSWYKDNA